MLIPDLNRNFILKICNKIPLNLLLLILIYIHFLISLNYSYILPWGGDEWYTWYAHSIMAKPHELLISVFKFFLGPLCNKNYIYYRQIGALFLLFLFSFLYYGIKNNECKQIKYFCWSAFIFISFSPFVIYQEQYFRYYSFYLTSTFIVFYYQLKYRQKYYEHRLLFRFLLFISPFIHLFVFLQVFVFTLISEFSALGSRFFKIKKIYYVVALIVGFILLINWKNIMVKLLPLIASDMSASGLEFRGITIGNFIKIPMSIFNFIFGNEVNPLNSVYVLAIFLVFLLVNLYLISKLYISNRSLFNFILISGILPLILMFLVIEPLTLPGSTQFESKHALFFMPFLVLILSQAVKNVKLIVIGLLILSFGIGLINSLDKTKHISWITIKKITSESKLAIVDGLIENSFSFYIPNCKKINLYDFSSKNLNDSNLNQISLVLNDHKSYRLYDKNQMWNTGTNSKERLQVLLIGMNIIKKFGYKLVNSYVNYPLQVFVFQKSKQENYISNSFDFPVIYGFEYKDILFPLKIEGKTYLGLAKLSQYDTIKIDSNFFYFIENKIPMQKMKVATLFKGSQYLSLNLGKEYYNFNERYNTGFEVYSILAQTWHHEPLLSNSFKYVGSYFPCEGKIYKFPKKYIGYSLTIDSPHISLYKFISK